MPHRSQHSRVLRLVARAADALRVNYWTLDQIDPDGLRYVATISVRAHWFVIAVLLFETGVSPLFCIWGLPGMPPFHCSSSC